jgi:hypothetical protein
MICLKSRILKFIILFTIYKDYKKNYMKIRKDILIIILICSFFWLYKTMELIIQETSK